VNLGRDDIAKITRQAKTLARREGHGHLADDFAQEALLARATGRETCLRYLFVDVLRAEYGRTGAGGTAGGRAKAAARLGPAEFDDGVLCRDDRHARDASVDALIRAADAQRLARAARAALNENQLSAYQLVYEQRLSQDEAAGAMGVTPSRVSQLITAALRVLGVELGLEDLADEVRCGLASLELEVEWIVL
jgi:DNA-directed RNA polymerase specialized sigma24 family protein